MTIAFRSPRPSVVKTRPATATPAAVGLVIEKFEAFISKKDITYCLDLYTGRRRMIDKAYFVEPLAINGHSLRAIQTTTAAPLCESAMMLLGGGYKGVVLQSQIEPKSFMTGKFVSNIYK